MNEIFNDLRLDILFKFVFGCPDPSSQFLLRTLVEGAINRPIGRIIHRNSEYIRRTSNEKGIRYDILFDDEHSCTYDVEMQNSHLNKILIKRFGYYGGKLINENLDIGEDYIHLKVNIQIICIDEMSNELVKVYVPRDEYNDIEGSEVDMNEENSLLIRYYVFLPYINELVKTKSLKNFSDFELIIYMMNNPINNKLKKLKRKVVSIMEERINQFNSDADLASFAFDRKVYLLTQNAMIHESKEKGIEEGMIRGIEEGMVKGKIEGKTSTILEMCEEIYPDHDCSWIKDLDEDQLRNAQKLLCKQLPYDEFYNSIMNFIH